ncbi:hypothetical protein Hanom_Chr04g00355051 [Helianthus anomalus]
MDQSLNRHLLASGYGDGPSLEDDPPCRRHVIFLPKMVHPPKLEGMVGWS